MTTNDWDCDTPTHYQCDECGLEYTTRRGVERCDHVLPVDQAEDDAQPWQIWYRLEWSGEWIALRGERYLTLAAAQARIEELYRTTTNRSYRASFF